MASPITPIGLALLAWALSAAAGCSTEPGSPGSARTRTLAGPDAAPPPAAEGTLDATPPPPPTVDEVRAVVPGPGLPPEVVLQAANNNLDLVTHDGRLFFAFRTAPSHFASAETRLYIVSTDDEVHWRYEGEFFEGTDLREPRLLSLNNKLFLYYAVLGKERLAFEPQGMRVTEYRRPGDWTPPEWFYGEGFIPWRARLLNGTAYLVAYIGGENLYEIDGEPVEVHWLKTADGRHFEPVVPGQPVVSTGGASETDFTLLDDGTVIAVSRNEAGDAEFGFGSRICRAGADSPGLWRCTADPRRFDSPLVFRNGDDVYLIGRRNVTEDGRFDLGRDDLPLAQQAALYAADYWNKPKRCALWRIDPEALTATFVLDLPSRGDTCFASVLPRGDGAFLVYNYSSPIDGPDVGWLMGQTGPTLIYRQMLRFPETP